MGGSTTRVGRGRNGGNYAAMLNISQSKKDLREEANKKIGRGRECMVREAGDLNHPPFLLS